MFSAKVHVAGDDILLACCDIDLVGKTITDEDARTHISERFYKQNVVDEKEFDSLMEDVTVANLLGDKIVEYAIKAGHVEKEGVITYCGVKHAQVYVIK